MSAEEFQPLTPEAYRERIHIVPLQKNGTFVDTRSAHRTSDVIRISSRQIGRRIGIRASTGEKVRIRRAISKVERRLPVATVISIAPKR